MKKRFISILGFIILTHFSYAQNTYPWPSTGNIGIGTASPITALHVTGIGGSYGNILTFVTPGSYTSGSSSGLGYALISNTSFSNQGAWSNIGLIQQSANTNDLAAGVHLSIHGWYQNSGAGLPISLGGGYLGINPTIYITGGNAIGGGNVGIGTISPQAKLSIVGPSIGTSLSWTDNASNTGYLSIRGSGASIGADNNLYFETAVGTSPIEMARFVGSTGNLGIGTANPDQKLTVNGTIHSKVVKVDLSVPFPDYVFKKTYLLPSLIELKTYIDQNHHLPGIPTDNEVNNNGLNLGEMNALLIKKMEEMTLYQIKLGEKSRREERRIASLEKALKKLTKIN